MKKTNKTIIAELQNEVARLQVALEQERKEVVRLMAQLEKAMSESSDSNG